eukprot:10874190-Ditylum_brightwellii.AAC.1
MVYMSLHSNVLRDINAFLLHGGSYVVCDGWSEAPPLCLGDMLAIFLLRGLLPLALAAEAM